MGLTNCNNTTFVQNHLQKHNCDIAAAVNSYFDQGLFSNYTTDSNAVALIFNKYKGNAGVMG